MQLFSCAGNLSGVGAGTGFVRRDRQISANLIAYLNMRLFRSQKNATSCSMPYRYQFWGEVLLSVGLAIGSLFLASIPPFDHLGGISLALQPGS
jgi:hypothetical protein